MPLCFYERSPEPGFRRLPRDDQVRWQRILAARDWGAPAWLKE